MKDIVYRASQVVVSHFCSVCVNFAFINDRGENVTNLSPPDVILLADCIYYEQVFYFIFLGQIDSKSDQSIHLSIF